MKDINLVKLKELAARLLNPTDRFSEVSDKFEWKALASPAVISALIEQLEAAQRAEGAAKTRIAELERQWEFRTPTPDAYEATCKALEKHRQRADAAEAELKRRDAQEPVAWIIHARGGDQLTQDGGLVANAEGINGIGSTSLFKFAPAAVPEKVVTLPEMYAMSNDRSELVEKSAVMVALDAAGVKWVEGE